MSLHGAAVAGEPDHQLGCVAIEVDGLPGDGASCVMAPNHALDLALRLKAACATLRQVELRDEQDRPPPGSPGPFSARF